MNSVFTIKTERRSSPKISVEIIPNVKICGSQVIMYEGKKCSVFTRNGIKKI